MDPAHLHLVLTHFPIVGQVIAILIILFGLLSKKQIIVKVALAVFVFSSITAIPVFLTGESAEETVEGLPGVFERDIEAHEELAEAAIWAMGAFGAIALVNLLLLNFNVAFAKKLSVITLLISLLTTALFVRLGYLGGQIRHSEIRSNAHPQQTIDEVEAKGASRQQAYEKEEDDD